MIGYANCRLAYDDDGQQLPGCVVPYNAPASMPTPAPEESEMLQYVMIDPGTPLPHVQDAPQFLGPQLAGFYGDDNAQSTTTPQMSSRELFDQLYTQNKIAFWVGGGLFGALALSGLFGLLRR